MKLVAKGISYVFEPVFFFLSMPFLIVYKQTQNAEYALKWEIFSAFFIVVGTLFIIYGKQTGLFSDYDVSKKEQRHIMYLVLFLLGLVYLSASIFFKGLFFPLSIITVGIVLGVVIFELVDYYLKASVHAGVITAWVVSMGILYGDIALFATVWMIPVMSWARISLKKHTPNEVITGIIIGTGITLGTFFFGKKLYF